jgi:dTDP-D-glucose 4,6-dehydratase
MQNTLITGEADFIGSHFKRLLVLKDYYVTALDSSKIFKIGFRSESDLNSGLGRIIDWYLNNKECGGAVL